VNEKFFIVVLDHADNVIDRAQTNGFPKEEEIAALLERNIEMGYEDISAKIDKRYVPV
jgi:hypothetical protein